MMTPSGRILKFVFAFAVFALCAAVIAGIYEVGTAWLQWKHFQGSPTFADWLFEDNHIWYSVSSWTGLVNGGLFIAFVNAFVAARLPLRYFSSRLFVAAIGPFIGYHMDVGAISVRLWRFDPTYVMACFNLLAISLFFLGLWLLLRWDRRHWRLWVEPRADFGPIGG